VTEDVVLRNLVADIAVAYFSNNHVTPSEIPAVINQIALGLSPVGAVAIELAPAPPVQRKLSPAQIRKSITRDALISFEDNKPYKTLRRHLTARGLAPEEYRNKWGLPENYPMVAPSYREARANLARARGFAIRATLNVAAAEPAVSAGPTEQEPAAKPVPADAAMRQGLRGLRVAHKSASVPVAFRPRESGRDAEASSRHQRWLAMLSETDWSRIRAIARQVNHAHIPAALTDLSAPLRVRACLVGHEARFSGEHVGTLRGGQVAVLISERDEH
jgi:predicted transcriptional regulator